MAEINSNSSRDPGRVHKTIRVDLTPMVDLGFLLISFFIFTTQINKPVGMKLYLPADSNDSTTAKKSMTLTLMPTAQNKIFVYEGLAVENEHASLYTSDHLNELRLRIIRKREMVRKMTGKPSDMLVLIKPDKDCSYQTLVDLLDEMTINDITRYAIEDRDVYDEKLVLKSGI